VISTSLPASRFGSDLFTFRQTLLFTSESTGNAVIEFYNKGKLAFLHKGTFTLKSESFSINSGGLKDRIFNLDVEVIDKNSDLFRLNIGDRIDAHFLSDRKIKFIMGGVEYSGTNQGVKQDSASKASLHGTLDKNNTPYNINLNYYDFTKGIFELSLAQGDAKLSGQFESHRYTAVSSIPLKGTMIRGNNLRSQHTGIIYPYDIYLPLGYATSKKSYPVVYVTDGQWESDLANIVDSRKKHVLMVFIGQGPDDRRTVDYQLPGADAYIQFLKQELAPLIETNYRVNNTRSFFGASLGGLLGGILISQESANKPFFKNYILADGSFWGITPPIIAAETANYKQNQRLPINILLTGTLRGNAVDVANYEKRLRDRHYQGLNLVNKTLPYLHDEMTGPTLTTFIDFVNLDDML
jgi:predicted alpha/beta superfamily hydrolase